jgi:hypothetical protein
MADDRPSTPELESREPTVEDLRDLCREAQVPIPFASPRLLWRMKTVTHREKDAADLVFLRYWFAERGQEPPLSV